MAGLFARPHDLEGQDDHHVEHYGVAIWKPALEDAPIEGIRGLIDSLSDD